MTALCGPRQTLAHTGFSGEQEGQRNLKQNHCFRGSGSDPSSVIVQENSWSVGWTNGSLLNISLWLTELPFSQDWDTGANKGLVLREFTLWTKTMPFFWNQRHFDLNQPDFSSTGAVFLQDSGRMNERKKEKMLLHTQRLHSCLMFLFIVSALCRLNKVTRADSWQVFWSSTLN